MKEKEENETTSLNFSIQNMKIMASSPITSWQTDREIVEARTNCIFLGSRIMAATIICNDFGAKKRKSVTVCIVSPSLCHEVMGPDTIILIFLNVEF